MLTKKGRIILSLSILLSFLSLFFKSYQLVIISIFFLSFIIVSMFSVRKTKMDLSRTVSDEKIFEGNETNIDLRIKCRSPSFVEIMDKLPSQVKISSGFNHGFLAGKDNLMRYRIECPLRGVYNIGPVMIRNEDPFSLFYRETETKNFSYLTVYPKIEEIKEMPIKTPGYRVSPGLIPSKTIGKGIEFFSLRDYQPGDAFKDINWKAYARLGKLIVSEKTKETTADIILILDAMEISETGFESKTSLIYSCRACASLANFFLRRNNNVGLITYSDRIETVNPGFGERQLYKILDSLASIRGKGEMRTGSVTEYITKKFSSKSSVIFISSLENDETIKNSVIRLKSLGFDLTIISPSTIHFESIEPGVYEEIKMKRGKLLSELRGYIPVFDWNPEESLSWMLVRK